MAKTIEQITENAELAFWAAVAAECPTATSGDFDPLASHRFTEACKRAVTLWVEWNVPATGITCGDGITTEGHIAECDAWVCPCGNTTGDSGFFPCDATGKQVEPMPDEWPNDLVTCAACHRIFKQQTGEAIETLPACCPRCSAADPFNECPDPWHKLAQAEEENAQG